MKGNNKITRIILGSFVLILAITFMAISAGPEIAYAEKLIKIKSTHQPTLDSFPIWLAHKKGWDKEQGLDIEMIYFDSGAPQIEAIPAKVWDIGTTGNVPMLMGALRYGAYMVGIAHDEAKANMLEVKPDSPLLQTKGYNPKYPDLYGSPDQVKDKKVLITTVSSIHYVLEKYLDALGLKLKDVNIFNLEAPQGIAAFESGTGDMIGLWSPFTDMGLGKGWKTIASGGSVGIHSPMCIIVRKDFADQNSELVVKWLDLFFRGVAWMKESTTEEVVKMTTDYFKEYGGQDFSPSLINSMLKLHEHFDLKEQVKMFANVDGKTEAGNWLEGVADFFVGQGVMKAQEKDEVMKSNFINDKFLKLLAREKGLIK